MSGQDVVTVLLSELVAFLAPVRTAATSNWQCQRLLRELGWDLSAAGIPNRRIKEWAKQVGEALSDLLNGQGQDSPVTLSELNAMFRLVGEVLEAVKKLPQPEVAADEIVLERLATLLKDDALTYLTVRYMQIGSPLLYRLAILLGIIIPAIDLPPDPPELVGGIPIRLPRRRPKLKFDHVGGLLSDPVKVLRQMYVPDGLDTGDKADAVASRLFPRLASVLRELGIRATYGLNPGIGPDLGAVGTALSSHMLRVDTRVPTPRGEQRFVVSFALSPADRGGLGLVVVPQLFPIFKQVVGRWQLTVEASLRPVFALGPAGFHGDEFARFLGEALRVSLSAARLPDPEGRAWVLGAPKGTRLELGAFSLSGFASLGVGRDEYGLSLRAGTAAFVLKAGGEGDSLLRKVLPPEGVRIPFDLGLTWSNRGGLRFEGGAGLSLLVPLHQSGSVFGLGLGVESLELALEGSTKSQGLAATIAGSFWVKVGDGFKMVVDRIGVTADLSWGQGQEAEKGVRFRPPDGLGMEINTGPIQGSGYLSTDPARGQYAGFVQLGFKLESLGDVVFRAVGLLETKKADGTPILDAHGKEDWSLILQASFKTSKPIVTIFGIGLTGVGLVVGINRRADVGALQEGVRTRALDALLFPPDPAPVDVDDPPPPADPVREARGLISTLGKLFPLAPGRYLLGVMVQLRWPAVHFLTVELAVVMELPAPLRLMAFGRMRLQLPRPEAPVVDIQLDAVGVLDFDKREASLDATVVQGSKVGDFPITGDMALRVRWGDSPVFILSAGGFHPRFKPPPRFPHLRRMAMDLSRGEDVKIRVESYLAITPNSLQFGGRLDLDAKASEFRVVALATFDAFVQFSPFFILLDLVIRATVTAGGKALLTLRVDVHVHAFKPLRIWGSGYFSLFGLEVPFRFGKPVEKSELPEKTDQPPVNVAKLLSTAFENPRSWRPRLPSQGSLGLLREVSPEPGEVMMHPRGSLSVTQKEVPLGVELQRVGTAPVEGPRRFELAGVSFGGEELEAGVSQRELFSRGQYRDLTDDQQASLPTFEPFEAGRHFGGSGPTVPSQLEHSPAVDLDGLYEEFIIDELSKPSRRVESPAAKVRAQGTERPRAPGLEVSLDEPVYRVAGRLEGRQP
jgi:hypothetical protein